MRIRRQLIAGIGLALLVASIGLVVTMVGVHKIKNINQETAAMQLVSRHAAGLLAIGQDYVMHASPRAARQWRAVLGELQLALNNIDASSPAIQLAWLNLKQHTDALPALFSLLETSSGTQKNTWVDPLVEKTRHISDTAFDAINELTEQRIIVEEINRTVALVLGLLLLALLVAVSVFVLGRVLKPIARLQANAYAVQHGDLSARIGDAPADELGDLARDFDNMTMTLQARDNALRASELHLRQIADGVPVLIADLDREQRFRFHNKAYQEVFGLSFEQINGHTVVEVLGPQAYESVQDKVEEVLRGHPVSYERALTTPQGDIKSYAMNYLPRYGEGADEGKVIGFFALGTDITERKQAQDEILQLNASLEQRVFLRTEQLEEKAQQLALTSKYKSEFLSNMSHELRTPLNSLLILAQILAENDEGNLSERQVKYLKIIHGSGKDLLALINDILDLSKIESGSVTPELDDVLFANVHESVERHFRHVAESRSLGFSVELAPGLPPSLYTDSQRLQQVLKNLLSNAFKFTQKGQVSVRIAAVQSGWSVDHDALNHAETVIGFFVTDTGIGLPADKQKIIFEAFQQADTGTARNYGGTGLGLSISRELAWLLGGELHLVMSAPGQGSTFALYLPLRAPAELLGSDTHFAAVGGLGTDLKNSGEPLLIIEEEADLAGKKVLVVDDDMFNLFALAALLERHKMAVIVAESGSKALEELVQNPDVDIVLMDIMMPEMDGYEAMRQIRQMKQFESLPMIAFTAKAMQGDREKCIAAGASDYLSKPVDTDQLVFLLRVWL